MPDIVLYTSGPRLGLPDSSPFVVKTMVLLKMAGLPFATAIGDRSKAPKGKLPYMADGGRTIADSTLIRMHLERVHGIDFDAGLTPEQRATGWALERMLGEHTYWFIVRERWLEDDNFDRGPRRFFDGVPAPARPFVIAMVRRQVRKTLHLQGLGRHTEPEREALAAGDFSTLAALLGEKPFLFGDAPHGADATVVAFTAGILVPDITPTLKALLSRHSNLVAYTDRMMTRYFSNPNEAA